MAYDERLAGRVREVLQVEADLTERRMFGGLSFLVGGNLAVSAASGGGLMVRVGREQAATLVARSEAAAMTMGQRTMAGWVLVESTAVATKRQLTRWVGLGVGYARSLPGM